MPTFRQLQDAAGRGIKSSAGTCICVQCTPPGSECGAGCTGWTCGTENFCLTLTNWRMKNNHATCNTTVTMPLDFNCVDGVTWFTGFFDIPSAFPSIGCDCGFPEPINVVVYCGQGIGLPGGSSGKWFAFFNLGVCCVHPGNSDTAGPLVQSCPNLTYGAFTGNSEPSTPDCEWAFDSLTITPGHCDRTYSNSSCCFGGAPDPVGPPPPPPDVVSCCPDLFPFGGDPFLFIDATMAGVAAGFPFDPGCDTCINGPVTFWYYRTPVEQGFSAAIFVCGVVLNIKLFCTDGDTSWQCTSDLDGVFIETSITTAPCTPGFPPRYFDISLTMNPGTNCFAGCACYGGVRIISDA